MNQGPTRLQEYCANDTARLDALLASINAFQSHRLPLESQAVLLKELNDLCDVVALSHSIHGGRAHSAAIDADHDDDVMLVRIIPSHTTVYGGDVEDPINAYNFDRERWERSEHARIRARPPSAWMYDPDDPFGQQHGVDWPAMQRARNSH